MFRVNWEKWFRKSEEKNGEFDKDKIIMAYRVKAYKPCLGDVLEKDKNLLKNIREKDEICDFDIEKLFDAGYTFWEEDEEWEPPFKWLKSHISDDADYHDEFAEDFAYYLTQQGWNVPSHQDDDNIETITKDKKPITIDEFYDAMDKWLNLGEPAQPWL